MQKEINHSLHWDSAHEIQSRARALFQALHKYTKYIKGYSLFQNLYSLFPWMINVSLFLLWNQQEFYHCGMPSPKVK